MWREMINKSCLIGYCANIKKDVAGGPVVLQEQLNPRSPEGMERDALRSLKAYSVMPPGKWKIQWRKNMKNKGMQLGAVLAAMLLLSMAFVPIVSAQVGATQVANEKNTLGCSGCANNNGSCGIAGNATELKGIDKEKVIVLVLNNKEVQNLQEKLEADGFSQKEIKAYTIPVKSNDDFITNVQVAKVVFKSKDDNKEKNIIFAHDPSSKNTIVIQGSLEDCIHCAALLAICLGSCVGCVAVCAHPATTWWACSACILICGGACAEAILACDKCYS